MSTEWQLGTEDAREEKTKSVLSRALWKANETYLFMNNHNTVTNAALKMWSRWRANTSMGVTNSIREDDRKDFLE